MEIYKDLNTNENKEFASLLNSQISNKIEEGTLKPTPKIMFDKGESVKVTEGPFESFTGIVEEVKVEKGKIQVIVEIFGRATPIDLDFNQVEKI